MRWTQVRLVPHCKFVVFDDCMSASLYTHIWQKLSVISCWADGASRASAQSLSSFFPQARILPKGILATEGIVSIAIPELSGSTLAITSHFLEFEPLDGGKICTAWQLEKGCEYYVILTTGAGLYRYRLGDIVRLTGYLNECPLVEFRARGNCVSDICGEKLHEKHIARIIEALWDSKETPFVFLVPEKISSVCRYVLYTASDTHISEEEKSRKEEELENGLCENPHYAYCRQLR